MWNFIPGVKKPEPKPPPNPKGRPKSTAQPAFEIPQMREGRLGTRKELELEERLRVLEARLNTATQNSERSRTWKALLIYVAFATTSFAPSK